MKHNTLRDSLGEFSLTNECSLLPSYKVVWSYLAGHTMVVVYVPDIIDKTANGKNENECKMSWMDNG